mgnify:CR=1 FL=1
MFDGYYSKKNYPYPLRRIVVWDDENQRSIVLLTNHLDFGATTVAAIYKDRWQIEIFFKALKQNLKVKTFVGTSENALYIQIWTALIAMLLIKFLQFKSRFSWSLSNLVAFLRWNLFTYRDLWQWIDKPFETKPIVPKSVQNPLPFVGLGQHLLVTNTTWYWNQHFFTDNCLFLLSAVSDSQIILASIGNKEKLDVYIPDNKFRSRDQRFASRLGDGSKSKKFTFADFNYDDDKDEYICPNGKRLKPLVKSGRHKGKLLKVYISTEADCRRCQLRAKCLRYKDAKSRHLTYYADAKGKNISQQMVKKIETQRGRKIYPQRIAIVEPVFANIRVHKRLDKFSLRGKIKVNIQWLLYCMVHNIEKVANYGFT